MSNSSQLIIRTEDIKPEEILDLFVGTERDLALLDALNSPNPLVIEGSRGTGKSFLLRVCEQQQLLRFKDLRVLPVYVSFAKSSLIHAGNKQQFQHWMLARICSRLLRMLSGMGLSSSDSRAVQVLSGGKNSLSPTRTRLEEIAEAYEDSYRTPGINVEDDGVPDVEDLRDAVEDICRANKIDRINLLFDEAAHIFRPEQQRQFFTLFRDLRSPYISCNAAVYPGVTAYGPTFEPSHDARIESLHRDVTNLSYRDHMREIILKQADSTLQRNIEKNGENFDALAYAVSGNPRLLLKAVTVAPALNSTQVQSAIKDFYRSSVWTEHSGLAERYAGHHTLIDWGRSFVEGNIIPDTLAKNTLWRDEGKSERTCFFWVNRDIPEAVKEAFRLLMYTGIVMKLDSGVVATRSQVGTRYAISIGCLAGPEANPVTFITDLRHGLSIKRFTEYGANFKPFLDLAADIGPIVERDLSAIISTQLMRPISVLDLTAYQIEAMRTIGINTIGDALSSTETAFQKAYYIGPKRSRRIMNVAIAAVLEYLSG